MTSSAGTRSNLPLIILLSALAVCVLCACCVVGGAGVALLLLRPTPRPAAGIAARPSPNSIPTVEREINPNLITETPIQNPPEPSPDSDPDSWRTMGDPDAPVVVEEFADFQCPFCGKFFSRSETRLREEYIDTGKVRFVFRNYIVVDSFMSGGKESRMAALGALCAGAQGKFWEYHDLLFENQSGENDGAFAVSHLLSFASDADLDPDSFTQCLETETYEYILEADLELARKYNIDGVPAFLINGDVMTGFQGEDFFKAIDGMLAVSE